MQYGPMDEQHLTLGARGDAVFVVCEGNFMYGNASLSCYVPSEKRIVNDAFARANAIDLGDVAQSMTIRGGRGYVVVNNSGIVFILDPLSGRVTGTIAPLDSPRYILPLSDTKAYISDLYASAITIADPSSGRITGRIATPGHPSTEQMVQWGGRVYVNCWSYDNTILAIDTATDTVVGQVAVGPQPTSLAIDRNGKLWTITGSDYGRRGAAGAQAGAGVRQSTGAAAGLAFGGGQSGAGMAPFAPGPSGGTPDGRAATREAGTSAQTPALWRIDAATLAVERRFDFAPDDIPSKLCLNGALDTLYYINGGVWRMAVDDQTLPAAPFISPDPASRSLFYALGVDPRTSEVYVGDAIDYSQPGIVCRYSPRGEVLDKFRVGIIPGAFCFY